MAETYAIVESGGKQYRAEKGSVLVVDRLAADQGAKVNLRALMFHGDKKVVANGGDLEKVKVEAVVAGHERGGKIRVFKYRPKKGYRRRAGHRSELTRLEVTDVKMLSRKPAAKSKAKPKSETKPKAEAKPKSETKTKPTRKAAPKKTPAKTGAAKKAGAKSGAAKKAGAKSGAARKASGGAAAKKRSTTRKTSTSKKKKEGS